MSTNLAVWSTATDRRDFGETDGVSSCDIRRVLAVVPRLVGGLRAHLARTYPAAASAGWRFTVVGPADGSLDALRDSLRGVPRTEYVGVPVDGTDCRLWPTVRALLCDGGFDLIHSHGPEAAAHAAVANLGFGVPHVAAFHELLPAGRFAGPLGLVRRWALSWAIGRANAVVADGEDVSAHLRETFPTLARRPEGVLTLQAGACLPHPDDSAGRDDLLCKRLTTADGAAVVGFVGGDSPADDGFPVLLEALRRLTADPALPSFHVAAFAPAGRMNLYLREVERRGLSAFVTVLDEPPDAGSLLRQMDLIVVPAPSEEAARTAMEAMAVGVPVLGADAPGLREALRATPSRTVTFGDAGALHHGLRLALARPWTAAAQAFAAAARVRFDEARAAQRLVELFERLTEGTPSLVGGGRSPTETEGRRAA